MANPIAEEELKLDVVIIGPCLRGFDDPAVLGDLGDDAVGFEFATPPVGFREIGEGADCDVGRVCRCVVEFVGGDAQGCEALVDLPGGLVVEGDIEVIAAGLAVCGLVPAGDVPE